MSEGRWKGRRGEEDRGERGVGEGETEGGERGGGGGEIMLCMVTARATNSRDENYTLRLPRFVA